MTEHLETVVQFSHHGAFPDDDFILLFFHVFLPLFLSNSSHFLLSETDKFERVTRKCGEERERVKRQCNTVRNGDNLQLK